MKRLCLIILAISFVFMLCSCSFDESENSFRGGELLDDNKMSEIKDSLFTEETSKVEDTEISTEDQNAKETENPTEKQAEGESDIETESPMEDKTEKQSELEATEAEETPETSVLPEENGTVYWTKGGSVWHVSRECYHIKKSNNVESGTVEDAIEAGKEKICSHCGK